MTEALLETMGAASSLKRDTVEQLIANCKAREHVQQVAYSVHLKCLTQICWTCMEVNSDGRLR